MITILFLDLTTIIVTHRLGIIRDADTIFTMMDGKLVEEGSHDTLMKNKGMYYSLMCNHEHGETSPSDDRNRITSVNGKIHLFYIE